LLANIALSVPVEHFAGPWQTNSASTCQRTKRRRLGLANYRIVRYAKSRRSRAEERRNGTGNADHLCTEESRNPLKSI
jgi:hypothetical protein